MMVEIIIFLSLICLAVVLTVVKGLRFAASTASEYELTRQAKAGNTHAVHELKRRELLPLFSAVQQVLELITGLVLVLVAFLGLQSWAAALVVLALLLLVELASVKSWPAHFSAVVQKRVEPLLWKNAKALTNVLRLFVVKEQRATFMFGSKEELRRLIQSDQAVLAAAEKAQLLGVFDFDNEQLTDHMVVRTNIITVDQAETVGPLLLDRLHKSAHNIFVVVDKNLDHVQGLLYMSDLVPLDPQIKIVKDAVRPTVHYLPQSASLKEVLAASLKTGRQFFLVTNTKDDVVGLVTLRDALHSLLGEVTRESIVATDPQQLHS